MDEMFDKIKEKFAKKQEELDSVNKLAIDLKEQIAVLKRNQAKNEQELVDLKAKWSKAEALFGNI